MSSAIPNFACSEKRGPHMYALMHECREVATGDLVTHKIYRVYDSVASIKNSLRALNHIDLERDNHHDWYGVDCVSKYAIVKFVPDGKYDTIDYLQGNE